MKKTIILSFSLLLLAGTSEAQWSFSGTTLPDPNKPAEETIVRK